MEFKSEKETSILVAEDTPLQAKKLKYYLEQFGHCVTWVENGELAIQKLEDGDCKFDLIITDCEMPKVDGLNLIQWVKENSETKNIPVIMLTSLEQEEVRLNALNRGANDFLNKPFNPKEVQIRVKNLIALYRFEQLILNENFELNEQLIEKNQILERNFRALNQAHEKLKEMQTQLVETSKMASLGVMGAGIAHEINNPLSVIKGYNERLNNLIEKNDVDIGVLKKVNGKISKSIDRIKKVVKNLNLFSGEVDRLENKEEVDLNQVILKLGDFYSQYAKEKDIKIQLKLGEPEIKATIFPAGVEHALLNIVHNAIDSMENVEMRRLSIATRYEEGVPVVEIQDTGTGIEKENIEHVFDPFFTTKDPGKGVGLGLSVARTHILNSDGSVSVESEPEQGTLVKVKFAA